MIVISMLRLCMSVNVASDAYWQIVMQKCNSRMAYTHTHTAAAYVIHMCAHCDTDSARRQRLIACKRIHKWNEFL